MGKERDETQAAMLLKCGAKYDERSRSPLPSPPGEGESFAGSFDDLRLDLPDNYPHGVERTTAVPSPGGEG